MVLLVLHSAGRSSSEYTVPTRGLRRSLSILKQKMGIKDDLHLLASNLGWIEPMRVFANP
jgi:hypothetical protein